MYNGIMTSTFGTFDLYFQLVPLTNTFGTFALVPLTSTFSTFDLFLWLQHLVPLTSTYGTFN